MSRCWVCSLKNLVGRAPGDCRRCRRIAERDRALAALVRPAGADEDLWPAIATRLDKRRSGTAPVRAARPIWWTAAAAALFAAVILGVAFSFHPVAPPEGEGRAPHGVTREEGPDLVVLSAKVRGEPAIFTVISIGDDQTMIFVQGERERDNR